MIKPSEMTTLMEAMYNFLSRNGISPDVQKEGIPYEAGMKAALELLDRCDGEDTDFFDAVLTTFKVAIKVFESENTRERFKELYEKGIRCDDETLDECRFSNLEY